MRKKNKGTALYFTEKQNIQRFWIRLVLLFEIISFSAVIYRQVVMQKPFGPYPVTDSGLVILSLLLIIPIAVLFFIQINITVSRDEICYKMIPLGLFKYKITPQQLETFSLETKSNETIGLKLKLKNKKTLFLPTKKPKQMLAAIQKMMSGN